MLDSLRKSGASVAVYLIFGLLIVIFVINFAPNAGQSPGGCMGGSTTPLTLDGQKANLTSYKVAYSANQANGRQKVYTALELLIRRELLAQAADAHGIRVTKELVEKEIKKGAFFLGGNRIQAGYWIDDIDGEKFFMLTKFKGWVGNLNVSMNSYMEEQARGMQAAMMADVLKDSTTVSREEARNNYEFEHNTATYDVVAFSPAMYRDAMRLTDADLARFIATHEADVKKKFADEERTYKATKPALKLRSIFIAKGDPSPTVDEAKAKLETARAAIAANKQKFADAAKQLATSDAAKANGGELGWRSVDNAQLGDKAVNDAVKTLQPGEMTPVITTDAGAYLVLAEDKREGDLSYDQVKNEIAAELARDTWAKEKAKRAALEALTTARAGSGKNLEDLFPKTASEKQGSILPPQKDIPAAWKAEDGSAGSGSAAVPAAGTPPAAEAPAAPATTEIVPSTEELPAFGEATPPRVATFGPTPRQKELPGIGDSQEAIDAVFGELAVPTPDSVLPSLGKRVFEHEGTYFLVQLKAKEAADLAQFDKVADEEITKLRELRGHFLVESWLKQRCYALAKEGKIQPMADLVRETDDAGKPLPTVYQPCASFR